HLCPTPHAHPEVPCQTPLRGWLLVRIDEDSKARSAAVNADWADPPHGSKPDSVTLIWKGVVQQFDALTRVEPADLGLGDAPLHLQAPPPAGQLAQHLPGAHKRPDALDVPADHRRRAGRGNDHLGYRTPSRALGQGRDPGRAGLDRLLQDTLPLGVVP